MFATAVILTDSVVLNGIIVFANLNYKIRVSCLFVRSLVVLCCVVSCRLVVDCGVSGSPYLESKSSLLAYMGAIHRLLCDVEEAFSYAYC